MLKVQNLKSSEDFVYVVCKCVVIILETASLCITKLLPLYIYLNLRVVNRHDLGGFSVRSVGHISHRPRRGRVSMIRDVTGWRWQVIVAFFVGVSPNYGRHLLQTKWQHSLILSKIQFANWAAQGPL